MHPWFYRGAEEWNVIAERLKYTPCPYCRVVGTLIRHGFLYGFDDERPPRKTLRTRRVFCSNREQRPGCGRTFRVWLADKIRRLSLSTGRLGQFLQRAATDGIRAALPVADRFSERTGYRLWKRFSQGQSAIRTVLSTRGPPPALPADRGVAAHTLAHLHAAFPHPDCPFTTFQRSLRTFFL